MSPADPAFTIGWREWVALPAFSIDRIKAKIDTGARTSALHAVDVERLRRRRKDVVRFLVYPLQRSHAKVVQVTAPLIDERLVRSSNGESERRPVIETDVVVAGQRFPIEITLTHRASMGFRMLLGRQALRRRFTIDPGRSYLGSKTGKR